MGWFDFVKDAGEALFGSDETPKEKAIKEEVERLGLDVKDLDVTVDGDEVKLGGAAATQEVREKVILAAGNVAGVARVSDEMTSEAGGTAAVFHTVERGDTLSAIAKKHLGDASKYPVIFEANKPMLSDPDKIYPGQVLRIPQS